MKRVESVDVITHDYMKRIIANVIGKDPLNVLSQTPKRLKKLVKGLKKKQLKSCPAPEKWSITQIIAHMADTELVLAFRLRMSLAQSGATLPAMDQDKWATGLRYENADLDEQLELFSTVRKQHLAIWNSLNDDDWQKFGVHEERGRESVERITQHFAGHDINHLNQIKAIRNTLKKNKRK